MSVEFDDPVGSDLFDFYLKIAGPSASAVPAPDYASKFDRAIFSEIDSRNVRAFEKQTVPRTHLSEADQRTQSAARSAGNVLLAKTEEKVEMGGSIRWGGDEIEFSGYARGEVHDDDGYYVQVEVKQNSDGTGSADATAGHKR